MGLTIHYNICSRTRSETKARQLVERTRQLAMDLPFDSVSEITDLSGDDCQYEGKPDGLRWLLIQCGASVRCPWNRNISFSISPSRVIAFNVRTGNGCEDANFGLCQYAAEIEREYEVTDDQRFYRPRRDGDTIGEFSYLKFRQWADKRNPGEFPTESDYKEARRIKTRLAGWRWGSFCKTQYASDPACGGVANFLRLHIALITLLERIGELPTVKVDISDEGHYGPATYSDDWREAYAAGRKTTYVPHPATRSVPVLLKELGDYNAMIAAFSGAMKDACGNGFDSPILRYANFESLEFNGSKSEDLAPFLAAMTQLAKPNGAA
jgi:hypothetical protein